MRDMLKCILTTLPPLLHRALKCFFRFYVIASEISVYTTTKEYTHSNSILYLLTGHIMRELAAAAALVAL